MAVKDVMAVLAKNCMGKYSSAIAYNNKIRKPIKKSNLSEIGIYRLVAEHCIENDIDPVRMVDECLDLLNELPQNLFYVKTSEKYHWLRNSIDDLKHSSFDDKNYICTTCYYIKSIADKVPNGNTCKACASETARANYQNRKNQTKKEKSAVKVAEDTVKNDQKQTEVEVIKTPEIPPFITINDLMTEPKSGKVTTLLDCSFSQLKNLLEIIDPYLIKEEAARGDQDEEATPQEPEQTV